MVLQSQFNSIHNYFSLLHHIFGRNLRVKKLLKDLIRNKTDVENSFQLEIVDITDRQESHTPTTNLMWSTASEIQQFPERSSSTISRGDHKPKWKDSILRRKNNGSHGKIIKGNAMENHSRLMNKVVLTEMSAEEPPRSNSRLSK